MTYQEFDAPPILAKHVKLFWALEGPEPTPDAPKERILPDGCFELIFNYGDLFERIHSDGRIELQPRSFLHGQIKQFIEVAPTGKVGIVAARLLPAGAATFLKMPVEETADKAIPTSKVFGLDTQFIEDEIIAAKNLEKRIHVLENFLISMLYRSEETDHLIHQSVDQILQEDGRIELDKVTGNIKISKRHFERKFTSLVGLNPKMFQRIVRFQNMLKLIQQNKVNSMAALSYEAGYYDQAHFIKDFKEFTGLNPKKYFQDDHRLSDFFTQNL